MPAFDKRQRKFSWTVYEVLQHTDQLNMADEVTTSLPRENYTLLSICALPYEHCAAQRMLDCIEDFDRSDLGRAGNIQMSARCDGQFKICQRERRESPTIQAIADANGQSYRLWLKGNATVINIGSSFR